MRPCFTYATAKYGISPHIFTNSLPVYSKEPRLAPDKLRISNQSSKIWNRWVSLGGQKSHGHLQYIWCQKIATVEDRILDHFGCFHDFFGNRSCARIPPDTHGGRGHCDNGSHYYFRVVRIPKDVIRIKKCCTNCLKDDGFLITRHGIRTYSLRRYSHF
ncbi:hypothetical protein RF11_05669 [Thelohanellus kitauei]|uniref:Uncharacterized protein n=1 Tax=Thelohanellus kitauei TaxID=669202 RepID=A0A0C2M782_THEKT|nr:hypothetical protein RF11_05669 [Thelohanellus kitauei]